MPTPDKEFLDQISFSTLGDDDAYNDMSYQSMLKHEKTEEKREEFSAFLWEVKSQSIETCYLMDGTLPPQDIISWGIGMLEADLFRSL